MAQAEGTSKNDGSVNSRDSGAAGKSNDSFGGGFSLGGGEESYSGSQPFGGRGSRDDSRGVGGFRSDGSFHEGSNAGRGGKTGGSLASIGRALGAILGGGIGGFAGAYAGRTADAAFSPSGRATIDGPVSAADMAFNGIANPSAPAAFGTTLRDFSSIKNQAARTMAETWHGLGWSDQVIAAGLGNAQQESSFNGKARNKGDAADGTDSIGFFQHNQDRAEALSAFAAEKGTTTADPKTVAEFVDKEMKSPRFSGAWKAINEAPTVEEASNAWATKYEVSKSAHKTRAGYSRNFANDLAGLGASPEVVSAVDGIQNIGKPIGSKPSQQNTDPFGLGSMVASFFGVEDPNVGRQKDGSYVDPMVSSVAGRQTRGEKDPNVESARNADIKREGAMGVVDAAEKGKGITAARGVLGALRDPIGFAIDTVVDFGKNSQAMNTPGPEGIGGDGEFGLGFLDGLLGGPGGGSAGVGGGSGNDSGRVGVKKPIPVSSAEVASITPATPTPTVRKPFGWSIL